MCNVCCLLGRVNLYQKLYTYIFSLCVQNYFGFLDNLYAICNEGGALWSAR